MNDTAYTPSAESATSAGATASTEPGASAGAAAPSTPTASAAQADPAGAPAYEPTIVGHRGAALVVAENTMESFQRALTDGASVVECDVHLSKDGSVIVMHDETIDRTSAADSPITTGALNELTDEQLSTVVLDGGHHVPHLPELLAVQDLEMYVEVKVAEAATAAARLMHEQRPDNGARDTVISFVPEALQVVKQEAPRVQLGLLLDSLREGAWEFMEENQIGWLSCSIDGLTEADMAEARRRGMKVNTWTVNSREQLEKAVSLRPDSISTDDPAWCARELVEILSR